MENNSDKLTTVIKKDRIEGFKIPKPPADFPMTTETVCRYVKWVVSYTFVPSAPEMTCVKALVTLLVLFKTGLTLPFCLPPNI